MSVLDKKKNENTPKNAKNNNLKNTKYCIKKFIIY